MLNTLLGIVLLGAVLGIVAAVPRRRLYGHLVRAPRPALLRALPDWRFARSVRSTLACWRVDRELGVQP